MKEVTVDNVREMLKGMDFDVPRIESIDTQNMCLEIDMGQGRTRLMAMSDLIDPYQVERMEEQEKLKDFMDMEAAMGICTKDEPHKQVTIVNCLQCPFCLPPGERVNGMMCKYERKINDYGKEL